jgi:protein SCO1/2
MTATDPFAPDDEFAVPRWLKVLGGLFSVAIIGAMAFAYFEPVQVLPRVRLAPGFALADQSGEAYTSESARGVITVYTFAPAAADCDTCDRIDRTMAELADRTARSEALDGLELRFVTVSLDTDDPGTLARAAARSGADGERWRWVGGDATRIRNVVGGGFRRFYEVTDGEAGTATEVRFDPAFVLVDGNGVIRGEYAYQTLADDADKISSHLEVLADEIRYAKGAAAVAYEAAHLFLCYP